MTGPRDQTQILMFECTILLTDPFDPAAPLLLPIADQAS